ncbi:CGNR zinc finger domain-containing protein [Wukongibacter baidiensis]|uniref:CGNR zinc finger domain-containing protein n=1 Tax=Wukongibacter baidiensis TaxID=1723361 RepID=UPI003D7F8910
MEFLCIDFVNSQWYNTHKTYVEPLKDHKWMDEFLRQWNLETELELTEDTINVLLDLRLKLTNYFEKIFYNREIDQKDVDQINDYLALSKVKRKLLYSSGEYLSQLTTVTKDLNWIVSEIVASFVMLLTEYDDERIKICENPECKWVFYDESRSRTRRWCDSKCGNLMKVRRFREKQKNKKD